MRAENQRLCIGLGFFRTFAVAVPHPPQAVPPPPGGGYKGCGGSLKQLDKPEFVALFQTTIASLKAFPLRGRGTASAVDEVLHKVK